LAEAVLPTLPARLPAVGPDTGHLAWTGSDRVAVIKLHAERIGAVHVKDIRREGKSCRYAGTRHILTEPGRVDIDLDGVIGALASLDGWYSVEVDIADQPTVQQSAKVAIEWLRPRLEARC
jgi:inosose dehydratase